MHYPKEKETGQQPAVPTVPVPSPAVVPTGAAAPVASPAAPVWPPPPRPRPPQGPSRRIKILSIVLAALLVVSGLGLLIYATTSQYSRALGPQDGSDATATARGRIKAQATLSHQQTATAIPLQTADAQIYATATAQAAPGATASAVATQGTATAQALQAALEKVTGDTPTLSDPLSDNSQGHQWDVGYTDNNKTGCNFVNSGYQVQEALPGFLRPCFADTTNFSDLVYQVSLTFNTSCAGGLILRANKNNGQYYVFTISTAGSYRFELYNGDKYTLLSSGSSTAILGGASQANTLAIMAKQGVFDLFINQTYVAEAIDGNLKAGQIGVAVYNTGQPAEANFSNAKVWKWS